MKVYLQPFGDCYECGGSTDWYESHPDVGVQVEVPDAIIKEWRELTARLEEINTYFVERVRPQIDEHHTKQRAKWRAEHPEDAKRNNLMMQMWSRVWLDKLNWFQNLSKISGEIIVYNDDKKK